MSRDYGCDPFGRNLVSSGKNSGNRHLEGNPMMGNPTDVTNNYATCNNSTKLRNKLDFIECVFPVGINLNFKDKMNTQDQYINVTITY